MLNRVSGAREKIFRSLSSVDVYCVCDSKGGGVYTYLRILPVMMALTVT